MRKKLIALLSAGMLLAGCSSGGTVESSPTPTPTVNPNADACLDFESTWTTGASEMPEYLADWEATRDEIDSISLAAEGDVKERIQALVANWPEIGDIYIWNELDEANRLLGDIERACAADGEEIAVRLTTVD